MNHNFNTRLPDEFWALKRGEVASVVFKRYTDNTKRRLLEEWELFCKMHKTTNPTLALDFAWQELSKGIVIFRLPNRDTDGPKGADPGA